LPNPSVVVAIGNVSDACGVCGGNNATCTGCDGVPNSGKVVDSCGVCGGSCDDPFMISVVNPRNDYQNSLLYVFLLLMCPAASSYTFCMCGGCSLKLQWTSPSANRTAAGAPSLSDFVAARIFDILCAGILAWIVVSIPLLPSRQLQFSSPLPTAGVSGLLSIQSPTLRADWPPFAALSAGSTFDVAVYLLSQNPLQRISSIASVSLNASVSVDACGVCGGNNATCTGCDGVPNRLVAILSLNRFILSHFQCFPRNSVFFHSGKVVDDCGVCGGSNSCVGLLVNSSFCINAVPTATWFLPNLQPVNLSVGIYKHPQLEFPIDIFSLPATPRGSLSLSGLISTVGT
jgi:hypothetical protein